MKSKNSIQSMLWKNFALMVLISFFLIAVPYYMVVALTSYFSDVKYADIRSASERMMDNYEEIEIDDILGKNGGVDIVTGDLQVIHLGGKEVFSEEVLSKGEWTEFLKRSGELSTVGYDIAYNEKEDFWLVLSVPVAMTITINYAANADSTENSVVWYLMLLIVGTYFLLLGLCAVFYAKMTSRRLASPIRALCEYTQKLENGDYEAKIEECGIEEIRNCQKGLNHLSEELQKNERFRDEMEQKQRQLVMEISHDLKNPLASIQGYAELLLKQTEMPEEKKTAYLKLIHNNSIRSNELLLSLFCYAQIESEDFTLQLETVDICEFLRMVVAEFIPIVEEKGFLYEIEIPEESYLCRIDSKMMRRVFDNLIENALKYNAAGTMLSFQLCKKENEVEVVVKDNGCGIRSDMVEAIFTPFRRLDEEARNSGDGGSGLGLAIVRRIVELHGGTVSLQSDTGAGCRFKVDLRLQ